MPEGSDSSRDQSMASKDAEGSLDAGRIKNCYCFRLAHDERI